jgi:hypothetical protein
MPRIVYVLLSNGGITGGQKMAIRHVETLNALGFEAVIHLGVGSKAPAWLEHRAPIEQGVPVRADDVIVVPDDSRDALDTAATFAASCVVLSQNLYAAASSGGLARVAAAPARFTRWLCVSRGMQAQLRRLFPAAQVEVARAFADDRIFRPGAKQPRVALVPRKRPNEAAVIRALFGRLHPRHADFRWTPVVAAPEADVAAALGSAEVFLSLSRLESVGLATLEAMASGCVVAGFTGIGGCAYATAENGFWADEDDCFAAADALARAVDLAKAGGAPRDAMREAALETARRWSHAVFRQELEAAWMRLAPQARKPA